MSDRSPAPPKRPYSRPSLVTYGDILMLTKNKFFGRNKDGGKGFKGRTQ